MNRRQHTHGQHNRLFKKAVALFVTGLLLASICFNFVASAAADDVNKVKDSIMVVQLVYESTSQGKVLISRGTGFLINDQHLLTCYHIFDIDTDIEAMAKEIDGASYNRNKFVREAVVSGDVTIKMNMRKESIDSDFSILQLTEAINETFKKPVVLGDSAEGEGKSFTTQQVYALGFPEAVAQVQNTNTYTSADVTITDGKISKITSLSLWDSASHEAQTQVIQHSARLTGGNSGGPLVNESGAVIGINKGTFENYNYSISINQIKVILDTLNIKYSSSASSSVTPPAPTAPVDEPSTQAVTVDKSSLEDIIDEAEKKVKETSKYDAESISKLAEAIKDAKDVNDDSAATQSDVDSAVDSLDEVLGAMKEKSGMSTTLIIIIAAVAVVAIIVVIVIVMSKGKKTAAPVRTPVGGPAGQPLTPPVAPSYGGTPAPPVPPVAPSYADDGAGETSLLNEGAGETSVLGGGASGALVDSKGKRVAINRSEFTIGKERRKVDFVIDNSSVSRTHAKIRTRAGEFFILDLGSTNGTYVNGSKLTPNQETKLYNGDKIKISDEEFQFQG